MKCPVCKASHRLPWIAEKCLDKIEREYHRYRDMYGKPSPRLSKRLKSMAGYIHNLKQRRERKRKRATDK